MENSLKNKSEKSYFQKAQGQINEKLLIVYAFLKWKFFYQWWDISKIKFDNYNLEVIKRIL